VRLLRDSRLPDAIPTEELVRRLQQDVNAALPELIDLMVAGRVPALEADEKPQTLSVPQRDHLLAALATLPSAALSAQSERLLEAESPEVGARAVASRLLALGGRAEDLTQVIALATPDAVMPLEPRCEDALEWSVEALLEKDPEATRRLLLHRGSGLTPPTLPPVMRALADDGDPAGLEVLLGCARRQPNQRLEVFAQARRLGGSGDRDVDLAFARLLREHLDPDQSNLARAAILVLGELDDPECALTLIGLLEDPRVAAEAHWALCEITGLRLVADPARWWCWYEEEQRFFALYYAECLGDLHGRHGGRAVAAIRELSRHRLRRHEVAEELAAALHAAPPTRRRLLCNALEALGSGRAVPALTEALGDPDPVVVAAARRALSTLTGCDPSLASTPPPDPE